MRIRTVIVIGLVVLGPAAGIVNALPKKDVWYAQYYFLMQDYERKAYKNLSANGKLAFQKLYWEARSPAAKEEFDLRMACIMPKFKDENSAQPWNTDRARIYLPFADEPMGFGPCRGPLPPGPGAAEPRSDLGPD